MAVPNTTTFNLINVIDAITGSQDDLVECFAESTPTAFNPAYSGSKNSLLNFRDYNETVYVLSISPSFHYATGEASSFTIAISTALSWSSSDSAIWISRSPSTGTGNGTMTVSLSENATGGPRSGTVTITVTGQSEICTIYQTT